MGIAYVSPEVMWDTWLCQNGEDYHLFFLSKGNIGRAVSRDLIHWTHLPPIENMAGEGDWDETGMQLTGSVAKVGGRFYLCYGSGEGTPIGLVVSDDLVEWKRYGDKPVLPAAPPYAIGTHWRDLSAYYDKNNMRWNGYLFGIDGSTGNASLAHVSSEDYVTWTYHDPLFVSAPYTRTNDGFVYMEVPDYFPMGELHYMLFSSVRSRKRSTSGRRDASGTWYLTATTIPGVRGGFPLIPCCWVRDAAGSITTWAEQ